MPVDPSGVTTDDQGSVGDGDEHGPATPEAPDTTAEAPRYAPASGQVGGNGQSRKGADAIRTAEPEGRLPAGEWTAEAADPVRSSAPDIAGLGSFESVPAASTEPTTDRADASAAVDLTGDLTAEATAAPGLQPHSPTDLTTDAEADADTNGAATGIAAAASGAGAAVGAGLERMRSRRKAQHAKKARRGLRVKQRLWSVDPWSVFKVSALFYICVCLIVVVAGTLLWNVGRSVGTVDEVESFVTRMGAYGTCTLKAEVPAGTEFETDDDCAEGEVLVGGFQVNDGTLFRMAAIGGGVLVVAGSIGNVLMVVLLNLLNELTGGLRYTIVKEPTPRGSRAEPRSGGPRPGVGPRRRLAANGSLARRADGLAPGGPES